MSNDYEYLGDSTVPPMAPRPPTNAPPELISGLPSTPALKANDDVDLESNRPRGNNNLSFSDNLNPKRSEASVVASKTSRSNESDEESKKDGSNKTEQVEENKNHKCGTCWYIFAGVTICLAVMCLLGLGAFLLMNSDGTNPVSAALNGTNETSTTTFKPTISNFSFSTAPIPGLMEQNNTTPTTLTKTSEMRTSARPFVTVASNFTSGVQTSSAAPTTSEEPISSSVIPIQIVNTTETSTTSSTFENTTGEVEESSSASSEPTENMEEALPIEDTTLVSSDVITVEASTTSSVDTTDPEEEEEAISEDVTGSNTDDASTTNNTNSTDGVAIPESTKNGTIDVN